MTLYRCTCVLRRTIEWRILFDRIDSIRSINFFFFSSAERRRLQCCHQFVLHFFLLLLIGRTDISRCSIKFMSNCQHCRHRQPLIPFRFFLSFNFLAMFIFQLCRIRNLFWLLLNNNNSTRSLLSLWVLYVHCQQMNSVFLNENKQIERQ